MKTLAAIALFLATTSSAMAQESNGAFDVSAPVGLAAFLVLFVFLKAGKSKDK